MFENFILFFSPKKSLKLFFHVLKTFSRLIFSIFVVVRVFALICLFLFSNNCQCKNEHFGRIILFSVCVCKCFVVPDFGRFSQMPGANVPAHVNSGKCSKVYNSNSQFNTPRRYGRPLADGSRRYWHLHLPRWS